MHRHISKASILTLSVAAIALTSGLFATLCSADDQRNSDKARGVMAKSADKAGRIKEIVAQANGSIGFTGRLLDCLRDASFAVESDPVRYQISCDSERAASLYTSMDSSLEKLYGKNAVSKVIGFGSARGAAQCAMVAQPRCSVALEDSEYNKRVFESFKAGSGSLESLPLDIDAIFTIRAESRRDEKLFWRMVRSGVSAQDLYSYLNEFPNSENSELAKQLLDREQKRMASQWLEGLARIHSAAFVEPQDGGPQLHVAPGADLKALKDGDRIRYQVGLNSLGILTAVRLEKL